MKYTIATLLFSAFICASPALAGTTSGIIRTEMYSNYSIENEREKKIDSRFSDAKQIPATQSQDTKKKEGSTAQREPVQSDTRKPTVNQDGSAIQQDRTPEANNAFHRSYSWTSPDGTCSGIVESWTSPNNSFAATRSTFSSHLGSNDDLSILKKNRMKMRTYQYMFNRQYNTPTP